MNQFILFKAEIGRNKEVINIHAEWENGTSRGAWANRAVNVH